MFPHPILHLDGDAFAVAVERVRDPRLARRAVVVGRGAAGRGFVACASYEARALGVRAGMPLAVARRRAPGAVFVEGDPDALAAASRGLLKFLHDRAPVVEAATTDDFFLDLSGCAGLFGRDLLAWAVRLARDARGELGIPLSAGLAPGRLLARLATRLAKPGRAVGVWAASPGDVAAFLAPLPLRFFPGVGRPARGRLRGMGIDRIGQLAALGEDTLRAVLGADKGTTLWRGATGRSAGEDTVVRATPPVSGGISVERRFEPDTASPGDLRAACAGLVQRALWEARRRGAECGNGRLDLLYRDGGEASRTFQASPLASGAAGDMMLVEAALAALDAAFCRRVGVRRLRVALATAQARDGQPDLLHEQDRLRGAGLAEALDTARAKHGFGALIRASALAPGSAAVSSNDDGGGDDSRRRPIR